jgi:AAA domain
VFCASLEDNRRRLKSRMDKLFPGVPWPKRLTFKCSMPRLAEGGVEYFRRWLEKANNPRLVIVDTLAMVRMPKRKDQSPYEADYDSVKSLRDLAAEYGVAIVIVHHLRKAEAEDPFDTISGTLGLTGCPDTIMVLYREASGIILTAKGRDIEEISKALRFDKVRCLWTIVGDPTEVRQSAARTAIIKVLEEVRDEPLTPQQIAAATGIKAVNVRNLLPRMVLDGVVKKAPGFGRYLRGGWATAEDQGAEK